MNNGLMRSIRGLGTSQQLGTVLEVVGCWINGGRLREVHRPLILQGAVCVLLRLQWNESSLLKDHRSTRKLVIEPVVLLKSEVGLGERLRW